jgi:hypothetical protein
MGIAFFERAEKSFSCGRRSSQGHAAIYAIPEQRSIDSIARGNVKGNDTRQEQPAVPKSRLQMCQPMSEITK